MPEIRQIVNEEDAGMRLDSYLAENTPLSRTGIQKLIEAGEVKVNDSTTSKKYLVNADDLIVFQYEEKDHKVAQGDQYQPYVDVDDILRLHYIYLARVFMRISTNLWGATNMRRIAMTSA